MRIIHQIDMINDKKLMNRISVGSFILALIFIPLFVILGMAITPLYSLSMDSFNVSPLVRGLFVFLSVIISYFLVLIAHELVHGLFFKIFSPNKPLKFKLTMSAAHCVSPQANYKRGQMVLIAIAPFIIVNGLILFVYYLGLIPFILFVILGVLHSSGCIGDFFYIYLVIQSPAGALCNDAVDGFTIFMKGHADEV